MVLNLKYYIVQSYNVVGILHVNLLSTDVKDKMFVLIHNSKHLLWC